MTSVATSGEEHLPQAPLAHQEIQGPDYDSHLADEQDAAGGDLLPQVVRSEGAVRATLQDDAFSHEQVSIVDEDALRAMGELASSHGYLFVALDPPGPQHRGRLGLYLEEAIELLLEERGALPPGIQASTGLDASLSDQLYRARLVEMRGIALGIPSLEGITNLGRSLDAEDSAVLRWWIAATADRPVRLVISNKNTRLRVYPSPVLFETLFEVAPAPVTPMPPSPLMAESSQAMDLSDLPPEVHETNVLGTHVAPIEDKDSHDALAFAHDEHEETFAFEEEDSFEDDVDLPDLDRALGLVSEVAVPPSPVPTTLPMAGAKQDKAAAQLALDYESEAPPATSDDEERQRNLTLLASPPPPAEEPVLDKTLESVAPPRATSEEPLTAEPRAAAKPAELGDDWADDLDEDEFLRTLKEDSARAPEVQSPTAPSSPSGQALGSSEAAPAAFPRSSSPEPQQSSDLHNAPTPEATSPLPTKKIARPTFIRLADPDEAACDAHADTEPGEDSKAGEDSTEPQVALLPQVPDIPLDGKTLVDLRLRPAQEKAQIQTQTLSGGAAPDPNDPFNQLAAREWKTWVKNLEAARGPKPLSVIERMFVTDYTRLREAVRRGVADKSAEGILDEWRDSFAKSYSEAFDALRVRGKRPTMVLDLPELAARLGRLQGAKRVQLLLVDALRFDLGLMVQDRMRERADAALTERLLLWSALPSTTSYQLELLGKGPDGLKSPPVEGDEPPALVARGAGARVPRRVRTGGLELLKLDIVEDSLRRVGPPVSERMDTIANETADALVEHLSKLPPRTMVVAFGDHGFALDPTKAGTTEEVRQGGSSPEEILVPAFAWLTGAVH